MRRNREGQEAGEWYRTPVSTEMRRIRLGETAARKSYQDFLRLWKDADPDIPTYKQAKAEYAKLQ
jgi:hypothetical protein